MALNNKTGADVGPLGLDATPQNYTTLGSLIDPTKPDVRDLYIETFGDQGITGFLELTGAKKSAGTADETHWYEEGRLHRTLKVTVAANGACTITERDGSNTAADLYAFKCVRLNDVLLAANGERLVVTARGSGNVATFTAQKLASGNPSTGTSIVMNIIGNTYEQGSDQPTEYYETALTLRKNPFVIVKESFEVSGSQATNIGWLNVNGEYRWYHKNEMDARKRFMNEREAMLVYSQKGANTLSSGGVVAGSEGYVAAVEDRGIVTAAAADVDFTALSDIDDIIIQLDKEGAPAEYAMYLNRALSLKIDSLLGAAGAGATLSSGLATQYGAFNNDKDMAVALGFKSFTRGGYNFHKHDWKLLNDPTMGGLDGVGSMQGALIPMTQVADAQTGVKSPSLEMNYKSAGNYSRDMEHWIEGGGVLGYNTDGKDRAKFNYRSECNLCVRAANQHVLLKVH